jgi:hypothetical protein
MSKTDRKIDETKRLMGALVRMKPKPHEDMKLGGTKRIPEKPKPKSDRKT